MSPETGLELMEFSQNVFTDFVEFSDKKIKNEKDCFI